MNRRQVIIAAVLGFFGLGAAKSLRAAAKPVRVSYHRTLMYDDVSYQLIGAVTEGWVISATPVSIESLPPSWFVLESGFRRDRIEFRINAARDRLDFKIVDVVLQA